MSATMQEAEMEAGRELDALVAEKVMKNKHSNPETFGRCPTCGYDAFYPDLPRYSTDIAAAWEVVEKMADTPGPNGDHWGFMLDYNGVDCVAAFGHWEDWEAKGAADTAPHAICLAALAALKHPTP